MGKYRYIRVNGIRYLEHRYIMQCFIGRKLTSKEIIHHINNDKSDNRIDNLVLMTHNQHAALHKVERKLAKKRYPPPKPTDKRLRENRGK